MNLDELDAVARGAAPTGTGADRRTHTVPLFKGAASHYHVRVGIGRLRARAWIAGVRERRALAEVRSFVQFTGFPRSGHSLVGALLDAHPNVAIAHELDATGLFAKGIPAGALPALALDGARRFRAAGRWWNGLGYEVRDAPPETTLLVVGDKKGDWTSRWCALEPDLPARLRAAAPWRTPYVLVTRHPLDNIATMSLRLGRAYDRLRIGCAGEAFGAALKRAQAAGEIAAAVPDAMIDDYEGLCAATEAMRRRVPAEDWHALRYEAMVERPADAFAELAGFLGLPAERRWIDAASDLVGAGGRSRDKLRWTEAQRVRVDGIVARYAILHGYLDG